MTPEILQERRCCFPCICHMSEFGAVLAHEANCIGTQKFCASFPMHSIFAYIWFCVPLRKGAKRFQSLLTWEDVFGKPLCHADLHRTINWV